MERSEFDIREHQRAGLTPNARVCLHAERNNSSLLFLFTWSKDENRLDLT
ncbi:MAG: hypothetical protein KZY73_06220 [Bacillaceae bacterium]|nr:hypothetical protein [Bacillus safensis]MBW4849755.1 hypothetical protein [Bacillaceae bacterium]MBW4852365.1 hypothetical protein [Bacillaceae bacterium]MBW4856606.1 hypothetical protein [Bacillaceae bacterium]